MSRHPRPPIPEAGGAYWGCRFPAVAPTFCEGRAHGNLCVVRQVERRTRRCAMPAQEIGVAERTEGIAWRHVWLKSEDTLTLKTVS